jgi:FKBP-type peptidyl-prolyl cis-trans isomerase FkpA
MRVVRKSVLMFFVALAFMFTGCFDKPDGLDTAAQMQKDMETIDNYLTLNNISAQLDKSGVRFSIETLGTDGFPPRLDQAIKVKYSGRFLDGTQFDKGGEVTAVLNTFILGWQAGLSVWPAGTKGTLYVPSPLGYGSSPYNSIPANSILVFDVELEEVIPSNAEKARLAADIVTIDQYLESHSIDAVKDSTGVRYVITQEGLGPMPTWYQKCKFNYKGRALANNVEFFNGTAAPTDIFDSRMVDYMNGIRVGLSKIAAGGKITVYIPSGLAFGPNENTGSSLPANSIVIYDIELTELVY